MLLRLELYQGMAKKEAHFEECLEGEAAAELFREFVVKIQEAKKKERMPKK